MALSNSPSSLSSSARPKSVRVGDGHWARPKQKEDRPPRRACRSHRPLEGTGADARARAGKVHPGLGGAARTRVPRAFPRPSIRVELGSFRHLQRDHARRSEERVEQSTDPATRATQEDTVFCVICTGRSVHVDVDENALLVFYRAGRARRTSACPPPFLGRGSASPMSPRADAPGIGARNREAPGWASAPGRARRGRDLRGPPPKAREGARPPYSR